MKPGRIADILAAIATLHSGDRERARDPVEELRWDQIALVADYERLGELTLARMHAAEAADAAPIDALGRRLR